MIGKRKKTIKTVFLFIVLAAVIMFGFIGIWIWRQAAFSTDVLAIKVTGPKEAVMGEEIEYTVTYKNTGNFVLENPRLVFLLPENSLTEDGKTRLTENLKYIYPGEENVLKFTTRLLGKKDDIKTARATLSYTPHNLSARYEANALLDTKLREIPLSLEYVLPESIQRGREFSYTIEYASEVEYPLENMSIRLAPVAGFVFASSDVDSLDGDEYKLPVLSKGKKGKIVIRGVMGADASKEVQFTARLGMWIDGIFVVVKDAEGQMGVSEPAIVIAQQVNGYPLYTAMPGELLRYEVSVQNTGTVSMNNALVEVQLNSPALDLSTLQSLYGQVSIQEQKIIFDPGQIPVLQNLLPGQRIPLSFTVAVKNSGTFSDQHIKNTVRVLGISQDFQVNISSSPPLLELDIGG